MNNIIIVLILTLYSLNCSSEISTNTDRDCTSYIDCHNKATETFGQLNFKKAILLFTKAIKYKKKYSNGYFYRGAVYMHDKQYDNALKDLYLAIDLGYKDQDIYLYIIRTLNFQTSYTESLKRYNNLIKSDKSNAYAYSMRGLVQFYLNQKKINNKILKDLNYGIKLNPNDGKLWYIRGIAYYNSEPPNYKKAYKDFKKAIALNYEPGYSYSSMGTIDHILKKYKMAIQNFKKAREMGRNDTFPVKYIGISYYYLKDYLSAIEYLKECIQDSFKDTDCNYILGVSYFKLEYYEKAIKYLLIAKNNGLVNTYVYSDISWTYYFLNEYNKSIQYAKMAIESNNTNKEAYKVLGVSSYEMAKYKEAVIILTKAIKLNKKDYSLYYNRAISYEKIGEFCKANDDLKIYMDSINNKNEELKQKLIELSDKCKKS